MSPHPSLALVIPTLNAAQTLLSTIESHQLLDLSELIIVDGGSNDDTVAIAQKAGAFVIHSPSGRGLQLATGAKRTTTDWILFQHADTQLTQMSCRNIRKYIADPSHVWCAGYCRFHLKHKGLMASMLECYVAIRCRIFALPYGDQGLLITRCLYDTIGGYKEIPLMEDIDIIERLGRKRLTCLDADAMTSAERFLRAGYLVQGIRNLLCLLLYRCGVAPERIVKLYR